MNKPLDPERIEQENAAEETVNMTPQEEVTKPEATAPETSETPDEEAPAAEAVSAKEVSRPEMDVLSDVQIVERLSVVVENDVTAESKAEVDALKQAFYKLVRTANEEALKAFVEAGNAEDAFEAAPNENEARLKELLNAFREKKAAIAAEVEKEQEKNLEAKQAIVERIKELIDDQDDFYKAYNEFRELQKQWKEIGQVPQAAVNDLWKEYQQYSEKFYDLVKINNEMRDYDFKKNLELKQHLIEAVKRLENEPDIVSAFYQLQKFHQEWREIGPVAKELRDEVWAEFKQVSSVINKKHQAHFETLRAMEERNLEEKTALCEEIEAIDYTTLTNYKQWEEQNRRVLELQEKWKTIGFAPKKHNVKIFERFRAACDVFFRNKSDFYKQMKESMEVNLAQKIALCEKAEELKDSQDWKATTDKLIALQKEWKAIGPVPRKVSDSTWKRFVTACDYFFEQKNQHFSSQKSEETENLARKKEVIEKINAIDESLPAAEVMPQLKALINEFNSIGFVPFREKDKIYKEYRTAIDKHYDRLKVDESERRLQNFKANIRETKGGDRSKGKLLSERDKLMRTYDRLKNDIQTYENNIGFLSVSSKGGGGLVKEMERKIESLRGELDLIVKKIELIDQSFDAPEEK